MGTFFHWVIAALAFLAASVPLTGRELVEYARSALEPARHASVMFGGDMMFDRTIRTTADKKGGDFIFSCIDDTLKSADVVVANLEGPITAHASVSAASSPGDEFNYTFTFPTSTAPLLLAHQVSIVDLGNNHIQNFGRAGVRETTAALRASGVEYFGDPIDHSVVEREVNGIKLAFVGYNEFGGSASTTISQIARERSLGYLPVAYTHWGVEYAATSSPYMRELAHRFIDAGAEMVVGSHPHVVEEREFYRGKHIYYSLGNFIFDQYWNEDVRRGLLVVATFDQSGAKSVTEYPVRLERDRRTCPVK